MADKSFSTTTVVPPHHPTIVNGTNMSQNLIDLNVNAQVLLAKTHNHELFHMVAPIHVSAIRV